MSKLSEKLSMVSSEPGVYLMKDTNSKVIYVGKAKNLKKRVASYFNKTEQKDLKTNVLIKKIFDFETIITSSEKEALILEATLIKKHKPRYNIILKDGKGYPYLRINTSTDYPFISFTRKLSKDKALYFGPFTSPSAVHKTLKIINKTFKLRKCKRKNLLKRSRPCLNFQIGVCLGPCCNNIDKTEYNEIVKEVILFLKGRLPDLIKKIKIDMQKASENLDFENAAILRDKLFAIEETLEKQSVVTSDFMDRDVIGLAKKNELYIITVLIVRNGFLMGTRHFNFSENILTDSEIIESFIHQYYEKAHFIPKEIFSPVVIENSPIIEDFLYNIKGKKVKILSPLKGEKKRLIEMAEQNAWQELEDKIAFNSGMDILIKVKNQIKMDKIPIRIECFDNSNISGTEAVAGMVVFENGKPDKSSYRKYKIKSVTKQDDYAYMNEVLTRRYDKKNKSLPMPDLLMVDGGRGQLSIAVDVIKKLGLENSFQIIGIAKKNKSKGETDDKIYKPGRSNHINFTKDNQALFFLQKIRDEAHRFAISFHRSRRNKTSIVSVLDNIEGVGKKRKKMLIQHFGGIEKIKQASLEEIESLPGINKKIALSIQKTLMENI